jgi:hypothetical protein
VLHLSTDDLLALLFFFTVAGWSAKKAGESFTDGMANDAAVKGVARRVIRRRRLVRAALTGTKQS